MKILVADDEPSMLHVLREIIEDGRYEFCSVCDGEAVLEAVEEEKPDLIILDVMMPKLDGFRACSALRERGVTLPILILSAKGDIVDKSVGFTAGADDYLVKPFSPEELLMRIQAHLRHHERIATKQSPIIKLHGLEIDTAKHRLNKQGIEISLTPKEFHMLAYLAEHPGEIVTRKQLVGEVWGEEFVDETSSIAVFIRKIREKIEDDPSHPQLIKTVRNAGYIFASDARVDAC